MFPRAMQPGNYDNGTKSRREYKVDYVLIMVCVFSGYAWFRPMFNNSQWELCYELTRWANEFGWPQIIHADNGPPFHSRMLISLCRDHDTFLVHGRPYHPQSQGKVERLIRTLKNIVRKLQEDDSLLPKQPWLQYLSRAVFGYNRTPHCKTGVAPFVAFFGRGALEGFQFRGEWEMNDVERESRDIVIAPKQQPPKEAETDDDTLTEYVEHLASPPDDQDEADRGALFQYLVEQQPKLLAQIRALQDRKNSAMVRRSIRAQGELKPVHHGDRVVFSKVSGLTLGMSANPFKNLVVGTIIDAHLGGKLQTFTIQEDNKTIHQRVPRENIGIRVPGYNVTATMKDCATKTIVAQTQSFALKLGQTLGIEAPDFCIDAQPGLKGSTFAQVPFRDPIPTHAIEHEAAHERQRMCKEETCQQTFLARPIPKGPGSERHRFEQAAFSGEHPQTTVHVPATKHTFVGRSCPGCTCNDCEITLGGKSGKACATCYREMGLTFCQTCHRKRQTSCCA